MPKAKSLWIFGTAIIIALATSLAEQLICMIPFPEHAQFGDTPDVLGAVGVPLNMMS